jgi:hypothetical protein
MDSNVAKRNAFGRLEGKIVQLGENPPDKICVELPPTTIDCRQYHDNLKRQATALAVSRDHTLFFDEVNCTVTKFYK